MHACETRVKRDTLPAHDHSTHWAKCPITQVRTANAKHRPTGTYIRPCSSREPPKQGSTQAKQESNGNLHPLMTPRCTSNMPHNASENGQCRASTNGNLHPVLLNTSALLQSRLPADPVGSCQAWRQSPSEQTLTWPTQMGSCQASESNQMLAKELCRENLPLKKRG